MANKKVYDLAKEYGIASKDFVKMLQDAEIPVKNHMSSVTEQQEKYFRNNYVILEGKAMTKEEAEKNKAKAEKAEKPSQEKTTAPKENVPVKDKAKDETQPSRQPKKESRPRDNQERSRDNNNQTRERDSQKREYTPREGQTRDNRNSQNRDGQKREYQPRDGQKREYTPRDGQSRDNRNSQNRDGQKREYQPRDGQKREYTPRDGQSRDNRNSQNRDGRREYQPRDGQRDNRNNQGNYNNRSNQGGYDKDRDKVYDRTKPTAQNRNQTQRKSTAPVAQEGLEKQKIDKSKKESKQKNEQKSRAKENFYSDDMPSRSIDNAKKVKGNKGEYKKKKAAEKEEKMFRGVEGPVTLPESMSVSELAEKVMLKPTDIIKTLMGYGMMVTMNQVIDFETMQIICEELGIEARMEQEEDIIENILARHYADEDKLMTRPPIITVMGHVDHGKTSLLDAIRNTNVIKGEAGGITQHIGAYTIELNGEAITFIDTPGHEAFTAMRSRGASVTDIAVLVVAADDGIMPQTVEAINHAKAAEVPIIVAINKIDKTEANIDKVKQGLTEYGLVSEDWGGDTICVPISAKKGIGIEELLDMILLVAEVEDLKANFELPAVGTIIESRIDKQRGVTATLLVKSGMMKDGDIVVTGTVYGKIRVMTDDKGNKLSQAGPSRAVEILGLDAVPDAGSKFYIAESEKEAKRITDQRKDRQRALAAKSSGPVSLDDLFEQISQGQLKEIQLIVKTDVHGSFEAIKQSLEKLSDNGDNIAVRVIHGGAGAVTESDVTLAAASNALIIAFNVRPDAKARDAAAKEGIEIRTYNVIYNILEEVEAAMKGMLEPEFREVVTGSVEVRQLFKVPNVGTVAGGYVTGGTVSRKENVRVIRNGIVIYEGVIASLRRFKDDVREVAAGYECGIGIEKYNDIKEGDILEFYKMEEIPR